MADDFKFGLHIPPEAVLERELYLELTADVFHYVDNLKRTVGLTNFAQGEREAWLYELERVLGKLGMKRLAPPSPTVYLDPRKKRA